MRQGSAVILIRLRVGETRGKETTRTYALRFAEGFRIRSRKRFCEKASQIRHRTTLSRRLNPIVNSTRSICICICNSFPFSARTSSSKLKPKSKTISFPATILPSVSSGTEISTVSSRTSFMSFLRGIFMHWGEFAWDLELKREV